MHLVLCQYAGKEMLVFGKWFSALLLTSRFNLLWSSGIFLREFRAGKKPSYTRADHLSFLSCLPKLTGVMPPCTQHDTGWEQMLSVGHADILGEGTAVPWCSLVTDCPVWSLVPLVGLLLFIVHSRVHLAGDRPRKALYSTRNVLC